MKLAEVLWGPEAWCQGRSTDSKGRHCLGGAVMRLLLIDSERNVRGAVDREFGRVMRIIGSDSIPDWNDAPERTWPEVAAVVEAFDRDRLLHP